MNAFGATNLRSFNKLSVGLRVKQAKDNLEVALRELLCKEGDQLFRGGPQRVAGGVAPGVDGVRDDGQCLAAPNVHPMPAGHSEPVKDTVLLSAFFFVNLEHRMWESTSIYLAQGVCEHIRENPHTASNGCV